MVHAAACSSGLLAKSERTTPVRIQEVGALLMRAVEAASDQIFREEQELEGTVVEGGVEKPIRVAAATSERVAATAERMTGASERMAGERAAGTEIVNLATALVQANEALGVIPDGWTPSARWKREADIPDGVLGRAGEAILEGCG